MTLYYLTLTQTSLSLPPYLCYLKQFHYYRLEYFSIVQPAREARRLLHRNGTFVPPAQWTRTRQGWKRILGEKQAVARKRKELPEIGGCQNDRNFGAVADVDSVFSVDGRKRAVSAVFRALGGQNGTFTFCCSPRRSDAPDYLSAPSWPFSHMINVVF